MQDKNLKKRMIWFFCLFLVSVFALSRLGGTSDTGYYYSLLPALLAVGLAFATHNIYWSLGLSVLLGGPLIFIDKEPLSKALVSGVVKSGQMAWSSFSNTTNLQILWFACFVLVMIGIIQDSGGFTALAHFLSRKVRSKKSSLWATYFMGIAVFIDDYASTMVVGSSMRPLTDKFKVSREKLAFIVDATSAPIAGLAIVSTWIGYEVGLFEQVSQSLKLGVNGYTMFFDALSARFYCLFMLIFIIFNIATDIDFGPMKRAEAKAIAQPTHAKLDTSVSMQELLIAIIPFSALLTYLFIALWFDGKGDSLYTAPGDLLSLEYWRTILSQASNNILILAKSATLGVVLAFILSVSISDQNTKQVTLSFLRGLKKGLLPVVILVLAWSLKSVCEELKAGPFLSSVLADVIQPTLFPAVLFLIASMIAVSTGTSWGTMAILIPTAIPLAYHLDGSTYGLITMISLGAILDGAIMGDHCSPISDTTILSSMSTNCNHMAHVKTQMPYSLVVAAIALFCGYLPAAFGAPWWLTTLLAIIALSGLFRSQKYLKD